MSEQKAQLLRDLAFGQVHQINFLIDKAEVFALEARQEIDSNKKHILARRMQMDMIIQSFPGFWLIDSLICHRDLRGKALGLSLSESLDVFKAAKDEISEAILKVDKSQGMSRREKNGAYNEALQSVGNKLTRVVSKLKAEHCEFAKYVAMD